MRRYWTVEEEEFLRFHYAEHGRKWCAAQLGRTPASVRHKVRLLGLSITNEKRAALVSAGMRASYASERRRLIFGLEPRTRMRVVLCRRSWERYNLRSKMKNTGYIVGSINDNCICYDEGTRRSRVREAHCQRIGIQVRPAG